MTRTCAAFGCKSNLKVRDVDGNRVRDYVTVFKFPFVPEDEGNISEQLKIAISDTESVKEKKKLTVKWINALPNTVESLRISNNNGICIKHFNDSDYIIDKSGNKRLNKDSYPSIFEYDCPRSKLNKPAPKRQSLIEKEEDLLAMGLEMSAKQFKIENEIKSISDIENKLNKLNDKSLTIVKKEDYIYIMDLDFEKKFIRSFLKIYNNLTFDSSHKKCVLKKKVNSFKFFDELIALLKSGDNNSYLKSKISLILDTICKNNINIKIMLKDQISNINSIKNLYSQSAFLVYLKIFLYSPKIYRYLRKNVLNIPGERHIRKYFRELSTNITSENDNKSYLRFKFSQLKEHEKIFVLMIDEIHTRQMVQVHNNNGNSGFDRHNAQHIAKTAFGFMIKSVFGPYKEMINLIPKYKNTSSTLENMTEKCIRLIHELGGRVLTIVTDNARVNIKMFENL